MSASYRLGYEPSVQRCVLVGVLTRFGNFYVGYCGKITDEEYNLKGFLTLHDVRH